MKTRIREKTAYLIVFLLSIVFFGWFAFNFYTLEPGDRSLELYSDSYWIIGLVGALYGLSVSKAWGGLKSLFGKSLFFFSLGLFAQVFGQITYTYFALVKGVEAPYPSVGDIGFFGSILFYLGGLLYLKRALGTKFILATTTKKIISIVLPLLILAGSYFVFLRDYESSGATIATFLDFGYPLGQAFYISVAVLIYLMSFKALGGIMKNKILLLILALVLQYVADFMFLYRFSKDEWYTGGFNDFMYQLAYLVMTIALLRIGSTARKLMVKTTDK